MDIFDWIRALAAIILVVVVWGRAGHAVQTRSPVYKTLIRAVDLVVSPATKKLRAAHNNSDQSRKKEKSKTFKWRMEGVGKGAWLCIALLALCGNSACLNTICTCNLMCRFDIC